MTKFVTLLEWKVVVYLFLRSAENVRAQLCPLPSCKITYALCIIWLVFMVFEDPKASPEWMKNVGKCYFGVEKKWNGPLCIVAEKYYPLWYLKKCNLTLAMSPTCHNNNALLMCWHEFFRVLSSTGTSIWACSDNVRIQICWVPKRENQHGPTY